MAVARSRRSQVTNYWPGFVDALSSLLLVIIFLLSLFMLSQFFLGQEILGRAEYVGPQVLAHQDDGRVAGHLLPLGLVDRLQEAELPGPSSRRHRCPLPQAPRASQRRGESCRTPSPRPDPSCVTIGSLLAGSNGDHRNVPDGRARVTRHLHN